ncbi:ATP-binding protein [Aminobacterium mobile]|uniref:ATP-binding protein n=1 Tax=Aminobacterium mobile TaxID=81467 RepID=UPI0004677B90|nr:ATP-binding protein [Aminobacterium mobile]
MTKRVLSYVRRLFKNPSITKSDLYGSMGDFIQAEEQQRFCAKCPGITLCKYKGLRWSISVKKIFRRQIIVAEVGNCVNRQREKRQRETEQLIRASKIPEAMKRCTFGTFITAGDPMIRTAKGLAMASVEDGASLILGGGTGVGKTHLAIAMVQKTVSRGKAALFVPVVDLLDEIRSGYNEGTADAIQQVVKDADCVALDDLGAQRSTSWVSERLFSVIDARYRSGKQTIITTNACSMSQLEKMLGERGQRIVSRLAEMAQPLFIKARDFRTRKNVQQRLPVGK